MLQNAIDIKQKEQPQYVCQICNYSSSRKNELIRHNSTQKH